MSKDILLLDEEIQRIRLEGGLGISDKRDYQYLEWLEELQDLREKKRNGRIASSKKIEIKWVDEEK